MSSITNKIAIALVFVSLVGIFLVMVRQSAADDAIEIVLPIATPVVEAKLKAYVSGAVQTPGVYTLGEGDRLLDLIGLAGGALNEAELSGINLAVKVSDEDHWHIPQIVEAMPEQVSISADRSGRVDLNSASLDALVTLPGIGSTKANSIISYRDQHGPFPSVDVLMEVKGIGRSTLSSLDGLVVAR